MTEYKRVEISEIVRYPSRGCLEAVVKVWSIYTPYALSQFVWVVEGLLVYPSLIVDRAVKYNQAMKSQIPDNQQIAFSVTTGAFFSSDLEKFMRRACKYDSIIVVRGRGGNYTSFNVTGFGIDSAEFLYESNTLSLTDGKKGELSLVDEHGLSLIE